MIQNLHFDTLGNVFEMGFDDITTVHGKDGMSPTAKVEETTEGATITITDATGTTTASVKNGKDGQDGHTPQKGVDYYTELENDSGYLTGHQDISGKADKTNVTNSTDTALSFEFSTNHNTENRTGELTTISFTFGDGEYAEDYISGLSFDSGETPTAIDYTDSGILNWVGTDCVTSDGLSIFQPSANTHYDIVFYFNGVQFIGLVNGFVPASGNEAA